MTKKEKISILECSKSVRFRSSPRDWVVYALFSCVTITQKLGQAKGMKITVRWTARNQEKKEQKKETFLRRKRKLIKKKKRYIGSEDKRKKGR